MSSQPRGVELYLHSPNVFMAWCLVEHRDNFTFYLYPLASLHHLSVRFFDGNYPAVYDVRQSEPVG